VRHHDRGRLEKARLENRQPRFAVAGAPTGLFVRHSQAGAHPQWRICMMGMMRSLAAHFCKRRSCQFSTEVSCTFDDRVQRNGRPDSQNCRNKRALLKSNAVTACARTNGTRCAQPTASQVQDADKLHRHPSRGQPVHTRVAPRFHTARPRVRPNNPTPRSLRFSPGPRVR
jgi:hypothetical protein